MTEAQYSISAIFVADIRPVCQPIPSPPDDLH